MGKHKSEDKEKPLFNPYTNEKQFNLLFTTIRNRNDEPIFNDERSVAYGRAFRGTWAEVNAEKDRRCQLAKQNREIPCWVFLALPQGRQMAKVA